MAPYKYDIASGAEAFTFNSVMRACTKEVAALSWCMQHGLIAAKSVCSKCAPPPFMRRKGMHWRCSKSSCRVERSVCTNSFVERSTAPISKLFMVFSSGRAALTSRRPPNTQR
ncbi:hypothetical protein PR001_g28928 [Phytophthora rubi]|uniref:Uncharacterized protein n=1 Tax=Phytophthora rubi TaxID=129364 RepID=A0A6A3H778_9STRA|nr:hypothetical protein PR001_g28928 [Phytophthora rubi]